jgi:hypothetical protein
MPDGRWSLAPGVILGALTTLNAYSAPYEDLKVKTAR